MAGLSKTELDDLNRCFEEMGTKPNTSSVEDLQDWMVTYLAAQGKLPVAKEEPEQTFGDMDEEHGDEEFKTKRPQSGTGYQQTPRLATFSGDGDKSDASFDLWKFEVDCLIKAGVLSEAVICQAAHIVKRLGAEASIQRIMRKLEDVYGVVDAGETLLAEFYGAKQGKEEDVTSCGCRLEDLLDRATEQSQVKEKDTNEMLRSRFWGGLHQRLKDASRHKFDIIKDFDQLRKEIRSIEREYTLAEETGEAQRKAHLKMCAVTGDETDTSTVKKLEGIVYKLSNQVDAMHNQMIGRGRGGAEQTMPRPGNQGNVGVRPGLFPFEYSGMGAMRPGGQYPGVRPQGAQLADVRPPVPYPQMQVR